MNLRSVFGLFAVAASAVALMGADDCSSTGDTKSVKQGGGSPEPEAQASDSGSEPEPEPKPVSDGEYRLTCDYLLGDFTESSSGYRFVAGGVVINTGDLPITVEVVARWDLLGSEPATETETYKLGVGDRERVAITRVATGDEIDAHQSAGAKCHTKATIIN